MLTSTISFIFIYINRVGLFFAIILIFFFWMWAYTAKKFWLWLLQSFVHIRKRFTEIIVKSSISSCVCWFAHFDYMIEVWHFGCVLCSAKKLLSWFHFDAEINGSAVKDRRRCFSKKKLSKKELRENFPQ